MKKSTFSEEQIAHALRQAESGTAIADVCRQLGISEATFYLGRKKFAPPASVNSGASGRSRRSMHA